MSPPGLGERAQTDGRFHSAAVVDGKTVPLGTWRVTTRDREVACLVAERFGGMPEEVPSSGAGGMQVMTCASRVDVTISSPHDVSTEMRLYGVKRASLRGADPTLASIGALRTQVRDGPVPCVSLRFRLRLCPWLGVFEFESLSWEFVESLQQLLGLLRHADDGVHATLCLPQAVTTGPVPVVRIDSIQRASSTLTSAAADESM